VATVTGVARVVIHQGLDTGKLPGVEVVSGDVELRSRR
jgi:hypothetical protein